MVFLGVLGTKQSFFTPEESICGVFVTAHVDQGRGHENALSDVATSRCYRLVFTSFEMVSRHMRQHTLASEATTTNPLTFFGHWAKIPVEGVRGGCQERPAPFCNGNDQVRRS